MAADAGRMKELFAFSAGCPDSESGAAQVFRAERQLCPARNNLPRRQWSTGLET